MCKYESYLALLMLICLLACTPNGNTSNQKDESSLDKSVMVDSIEQQIREADAELKSFLENK